MTTEETNTLLESRDRQGVSGPTGRTSAGALEGLVQAVEAGGGVATVSLTRLRDLTGHKRLGRHVRGRITRELLGRGLGHYPAELPEDPDGWVRVFALGSPIADLIECVLKPTPETDRQLRNAAGQIGPLRELASLLDEARELLGEVKD